LQLGVADGFVWLWAYCYANGRAIDAVAEDAVDRRLVSMR
jgi:hypothetical protein